MKKIDTTEMYKWYNVCIASRYVAYQQFCVVLNIISDAYEPYMHFQMANGITIMNELKEFDITQPWEWSVYAGEPLSYLCIVRRMVAYKYQIVLWQYTTKYKYDVKSNTHEAIKRT